MEHHLSFPATMLLPLLQGQGTGAPDRRFDADQWRRQEQERNDDRRERRD